MRNKIFMFVLLFGAFLFTTCNQAPSGSDGAVAETTQGKVPGQAFIGDDDSAKNILQIAAGSKDHSTLVAAVQAADLENVLANNGPLTVFAPTNTAFKKLPAGTVEDLLKPENKSTLAGIITFHAAPGTYDVAKLKDGMKLYQATGDYIEVEKRGEDTYVHGTKIIASVPASNGIIHVVEDVMLPPE